MLIPLICDPGGPLALTESKETQTQGRSWSLARGLGDTPTLTTSSKIRLLTLTWASNCNKRLKTLTLLIVDTDPIEEAQVIGLKSFKNHNGEVQGFKSKKN